GTRCDRQDLDPHDARHDPVGDCLHAASGAAAIVCVSGAGRRGSWTTGPDESRIDHAPTAPPMPPLTSASAMAPTTRAERPGMRFDAV
ncbi:hypothetical protein NJ76_31260, partial [Rhodococcus sp. IITR03]